MKKILSFLLALALLCSLSITAFAEDASDAEGSTSGKQAVKATVTGDPSWVLVIPADQTIPYLTEETDIVHNDCEINNPKHIPPKSTINASLVHTGVFTLGADTSKTLPFKLNAFGKEVAAGEKVIASQYWSDTHDNQCYNEINIVISRSAWEGADGGVYTTPVTYSSVLVSGITDAADGAPRPGEL